MDNLQFPQYDPPQQPGIPMATHKDAGPLTKMIGKMIQPKLRTRLLGRSKGVKADQNVHVKHKKIAYY